MRILKYEPDLELQLPVYGASADILEGSPLKRGVTPGTDNGMLISANGSSATPDIVAILRELHDYSVSGDTLIAGTNFVTRACQLVAPTRIIRAQFALTGVTCTQAVSTTTMTVTSLEDDIDASFFYVYEGLGIGQSNYLTAAAAGACTLKAAFGTSLDTTSKFIKILRRFHDVISFSSDGTKLASQAAAGAVKGLILNTYMRRNGNLVALDPTKHAALTGLNGAPDLAFFADIVIRDSAFYTVD